MAEPTDAIMPILQRIQADIAEMRTNFGGKFDTLGSKVDAIGVRMDALEDYFTYTMGVTEQNKADIRRVRSEMAAIKAQLSGPDAPPTG